MDRFLVTYLLLAWFALAVLCVWASQFVAKARGQSVGPWAVATFLLGFPALVILYMLPVKESRLSAPMPAPGIVATPVPPPNIPTAPQHPRQPPPDAPVATDLHGSVTAGIAGALARGVRREDIAMTWDRLLENGQISALEHAEAMRALQMPR